MFDFIDTYLLTPYVQAVLFILLVVLFWLQHRKFKLASSGFNWLRTLVLLALFLYFAWNWATSISTVISRFSILGMFFINLYMIYNLILGALDEKYRLALNAYGHDSSNSSLVEAVWQAGKKYLYTRHFFDALFSGSSPGGYLKAVVSRQIPTDIQNVLVKQGLGKELITSKNLVAYLNHALSQSQSVPQELKDLLAPVIKQFGEHAWIQDQVDEFLRLAIKDPEKLYEGGWSGAAPANQ